jgi:hypothetical protein
MKGGVLILITEIRPKWWWWRSAELCSAGTWACGSVLCRILLPWHYSNTQCNLEYWPTMKTTLFSAVSNIRRILEKRNRNYLFRWVYTRGTGLKFIPLWAIIKLAFMSAAFSFCLGCLHFKAKWFRWGKSGSKREREEVNSGLQRTA